MTAELLRRAAALMRERAEAATPGPWRDSYVDGNRYAALVADKPHPDRPKPSAGGWAWDEDYGGCVVGESLMAGDRAHIASWHPILAVAIADWLNDEAVGAQTPDGAPTAHAIAVARAYLGEQP